MLEVEIHEILQELILPFIGKPTELEGLIPQIRKRLPFLDYVSPLYNEDASIINTGYTIKGSPNIMFHSICRGEKLPSEHFVSMGGEIKHKDMNEEIARSLYLKRLKTAFAGVTTYFLGNPTFTEAEAKLFEDDVAEIRRNMELPFEKIRKPE